MRTVAALAIAALLAPALAGCLSAFESSPRPALRVSTTTSLENSGLLASIVPVFEQARGIDVRVRALGTGLALEDAKRGNADVLLTHAPALEEAFVAQGFGTGRHVFARNGFLIVGPSGDGVRVAGLDAPAAMAALAQAGAPFVSRGDGSGTHARERELWALSGLDYDREVVPAPWYRLVGQGMGATLRIASELSAYTLVDEATYHSYRSALALVVHVQGGEALTNVYSALPVDASRVPGVNSEAAGAFVEWLLSAEGRSAVETFAVDGRPLFRAGASGGGA